MTDINNKKHRPGPADVEIKAPTKKDKDSWFCCIPFTMIYCNDDGNYAACNFAETDPDKTIANTSLREWMNSDYQNSIRKEMLNPNEKEFKACKKICKRCISDEKEFGTSRRMNINSRYLADEKYWEKIGKTVEQYKQNNRYDFGERVLELQLRTFGSQCNLDCFMCHPFSSTTRQKMSFNKDWNTVVWGRQEAYKLWSHNANKDKVTPNKILEQITQLAPYIRNFKVIGGEPLVMKQYYQVLDSLIESGHSKNIMIKYQTNLTKTVSGNHNIFDYIPKFDWFDVIVSIDGVGKYNDYLRRRSNFEEIENNIDTMLEYSNVRMDINGMVTTPGVLKFYEVLDWFKQRPKLRDMNWWMIKDPYHLRVNNMPKKLKDKLIPIYEKYPEAKDIVNALKLPPTQGSNLNETLKYLLDTDERYKGTKWEMNLFDVFPELEEFYDPNKQPTKEEIHYNKHRVDWKFTEKELKQFELNEQKNT